MSAFRRRLTGLAALISILAILVGLPAVLFVVGANPFADGALSWDGLTRPDDGTLALAAIKLVAWVAWAFLAVSLLVEIGAQLRGVRAPRMPGLHVPQVAARRLVGAALALFAAAGPVAAVTAAPATATAAVASRTEAVATAAVAGAPTTVVRADVAAPPSTPTTRYTVAPRDTLWSIAEKHLGDGRRYTELVDLNADLLGGKADFLKPGWVLTIPAHAETAANDSGRTVVVRPGDTLSSIAATELGDPDRYAAILDASRDTVQPDGDRITDPDVIRPGWLLTIPADGTGQPAGSDAGAEAAAQGGSAGAVPGPATGGSDAAPGSQQSLGTSAFDGASSAPIAGTTPPPGTQPRADGSAASSAPEPTASPAHSADAVAVADVVDDDDADADLGEVAPWKVVTTGGVGTMLAASALAVVARRRRNQQRVRRASQSLPLPDGETAEVEQELRADADDRAVETIDVALRNLAATYAQVGVALPPVRAARLTEHDLELYLAEPATLPKPWVNEGNGEIWTLDTRTPPALADAAARVPAPFPALVTIGHDDHQGHVLLNLEHFGALGITGNADDVRDIAAALAIELATSTWADDLQLTLGGWFADLEGILHSGRIRYVPSVERVIGQLADRATIDRTALAEVGAPDLLTARATGAAPEAWVPEIILVANFMTPGQRDRLAVLMGERPRTAVAAITAGVAVGDWNLRVEPGAARAVLDPIGLPVTPQRIDLATYDHLLSVVSTTDRYEIAGDALAEPTAADVGTIAPVDEPGLPDHPGEVPSAPRILVLGPVDLVGAAGSVEASKRARLVELAAYLALNPNASHVAIDDAIWPDRSTEDNLNTRNTATSKLRRWVGVDADGEDYLPRHRAGGGYGFAPAVTSDVADWSRLLAGGVLAAPTESLESALALVRGLPFEGTHRRRYAWAEPNRQRLTSEIVDVAAILATRRLAEGRWRAADAAAVVGLRVDFGQESLWRLRILAAHQSRNRQREAALIDQLLAHIEALDVDLEPETEQLLADLRRRPQIAADPSA